MTGHPETEDHTTEPSTIERGERFLAETPRSQRGPAIPALRAMGLSPAEACEAVRRHNMAMARAG
ncbi:hypothetical protein D3227_20600 [Mesorhizobium waimense]|uniref:Uncharacterized protein n=1 Tax=Mesorhizobium waimense TaxID=1300307 RepID=A0A3A5KSD7_9HYPH|nr:hypothetical protein [Mesorhizobium waimense]RJT36117.1 hypothetical protein D3227_20600 [Mesorhizobium waimense]